jgi:phosphoribosylaminoimidazole-succinocarboxamide synthase
VTISNESSPLVLEGWEYVASGKVRDIYEPSVYSPFSDVILIVTTDKISAYDHVLPTPIPDKGKILTELTAWWFRQLQDIVPNHLVSLDVPEEVSDRAMICQRLVMYPVECVARGYLTGSGLAEYERTGHIGGTTLPSGLADGDRLPEPIFTPATKATVGGHDENVSFDYVANQIGAETASRLRDTTLAIYARAAEITQEAGMILADTKFEFGAELATGQLTLGDEVLTPDSSRYWDARTWEPGGPQASFDKQYLRDWLTHEANWDRQSPPPELPEEVVMRTRDRYLEALERLTGKPFGG